jgi:hypothetical protein
VGTSNPIYTSFSDRAGATYYVKQAFAEVKQF